MNVEKSLVISLWIFLPKEDCGRDQLKCNANNSYNTNNKFNNSCKDNETFQLKSIFNNNVYNILVVELE